MPEGYCTVEDVRRALQETLADFDSGAWGEDNNQVVVDAIVAQSKWLRSTTDCHFYVEGGITEDDQDLIPTAAKSRGPEEGDVPSTPHPQHSTMFRNRRDRYPRKTHGPFCRVSLGKNDVTEITKLEVSDASGAFENWVAAADKDEDDDWRLYVEPGSAPSPSYVDLRAASLPALNHYDGAVRVTYEYGEAELPGTIRRAVAFRAGAELLLNDEAALGIADNGQLINPETKKQAMENRAENLLEVYR